ncbi:MAG: aldehyde dehydrogenase family protein, partial [Pseudomonadota bacterium]
MDAKVEDRLAKLIIPSKALIAGELTTSASGETFDCISPIDGRVLGAIPSCDTADADRAVTAARKAFETARWSNSHPRKRKKVLMRFAALIAEHAEELALLETLDMGKPIRDSRSIDVPATVSTVEWYAEAVDKIYDELAPVGPKAI